MHKVLREDREGGPRPALAMRVAENCWTTESACERVARGEEGQISCHILKGLVHQINLSDLHVPLYFSRL